MRRQGNVNGPEFGTGLELSGEARTVLRLHSIARDPEWMTSVRSLTGMLRVRGLPMFQWAVDAEVAVGGALLPSGRHMGVFASLRHLERQGMLPSDCGDFPTGHVRLSTDQLRCSEAGLMLPLVVGDDPELWLDCSGAVHFVNRDDDYGYQTMAFQNFTKYVELFAFLRESMIWPPEYETPRVHRLFTASLVGARLAEALNAWPMDHVWGSTSRLWMSQDLHIAELTIPGFVVGTHVGAAEISDILKAIALVEPRSTNVEWQSPVNARSVVWNAAGLPAPTRTVEHKGSTIHAWGSVPHYNFEMKQRWVELSKGR